MKKRTVIVSILLILVGSILYVFLSSSEEVKTVQMEEQNLRIDEFNIKDRIIIKKENAIYVGNNIKELENDFYDIKIVNSNSQINIYLNKLWYKTYGKDYIQYDYLVSICRELTEELNIENREEEFEYILYKYIKDNYVKIRQNIKAEQIETNKLSLAFELEDNIVKLMIRGK